MTPVEERRRAAEQAIAAAQRATDGPRTVAAAAVPPPDPASSGAPSPSDPASSGAAPARDQAMSGAGTDDEAQRAFAFLLRSTQRRPQTEAELRDRLRAREFGPEAVEAALARARAVRAIDDAAFAQAWVADRGEGRGFGEVRLRLELQRRQVPEDLIEAALEPLRARDDYSTAVELARARAQRLPARLEPVAVSRRLAAYLGRRGYPAGLARRAAATAAGTDREWD